MSVFFHLSRKLLIPFLKNSSLKKQFNFFFFNWRNSVMKQFRYMQTLLCSKMTTFLFITSSDFENSVLFPDILRKMSCLIYQWLRRIGKSFNKQLSHKYFPGNINYMTLLYPLSTITRNHTDVHEMPVPYEHMNHFNYSKPLS